MMLAFALATCAFVVWADVIDLSRVRIVRARKENPQQKLAADELEKHLKLVCGSEVGETGFTFTFGCPRGAPRAAYAGFAKRIGDTVYFWGDDTGTRRYPYYGSAFAVYGFLETLLGVKWVEPGDDGIVFKPQRTVDLPDDWSYAYRCRAETALIRSVDTAYGVRMRYAQKRPFVYGHAYTTYQKRFLKDHPEWFGLSVDGTRGVQEKWAHFAKLCDSNPEVADQIVADWKRQGTPYYYNVCINDGSPGFCFCGNCCATDSLKPGEPFLSHHTDRLLCFWNRLAGRMRTIRPDVKLIAYFYAYYRFPPRREVIEYPENMIFGLVPSGDLEHSMEEFEGFRKAGLKHFFFRPNYLCCGRDLPRGMERFLYDTFRFYHRNGSIGFDYDGCPHPATRLEYYVVFRLCAFPELGFDEIMSEYLSQYGAAADVAGRYFARIRARRDRVARHDKQNYGRPRIEIKDDLDFRFSVTRLHSVDELTEDLRLLESADTSRLSPVEARRFETLKAAAKRYLTNYPEILAQDRKVGPDRAWEMEKRLIGSRPAVKADETVSLNWKGQSAFLACPPAERARQLADGDARRRMRSVGTRPYPVTFTWPNLATALFEIVRARDMKTVYAVEAACPLAVENLEVGERYVWRAEQGGVRVGGGRFATSADGPRWIGVPDAPKLMNVRDIGGWMPGLGGRRIRQGLVYRGCAFSDSAADGGRSRVAAPRARAFLTDTLSLRCEIDLRRDDEVGDAAGSSLGDRVKRVRAPMPVDIGAPEFRRGFQRAFGILLGRKNYPVYIHGADGAARTGALALVLEGLLGVSDDDLRRDWELSAFRDADVSFNAAAFDRLASALGRHPGDTLASRCAAFVRACGFAESDIEAFRAWMFEEPSRHSTDGATTSPQMPRRCQETIMGL